MSLSFPLPPIDEFSGSQLAEELAAAGFGPVNVYQRGADALVVEGVGERQRAAVEAVIAAHRYLSPEAERQALRAEVAALRAEVATLRPLGEERNR